MGAALALAARITVAGTFTVAAIAKLRAGSSLRAQLTGLGVPAAVVSWAAYALPAAELATATLLVVLPSTAVPAFVAVALLAVFTGVVLANLSRGQHVPCPCFGAPGDTPISARTLLRNGWLLALSVLATGSIDGAGVVPVLALTAVLLAATVLVVRAFG